MKTNPFLKFGFTILLTLLLATSSHLGPHAVPHQRDWYYLTGQKYNTATEVVQVLDGTGIWTASKGEGIYGSRPWKIFGKTRKRQSHSNPDNSVKIINSIRTISILQLKRDSCMPTV